MGTMSIWHWLIVALVVLLLFGKGRMSDFMGDLAKGIKSFKKGMADDDTATAPAQPAAQLTQPVPTQPQHVAGTSTVTPVQPAPVAQDATPRA